MATLATGPLSPQDLTAKLMVDTTIPMSLKNPALVEVNRMMTTSPLQVGETVTYDVTITDNPTDTTSDITIKVTKTVVTAPPT